LGGTTILTIESKGELRGLGAISYHAWWEVDIGCSGVEIE